MLSNYPILKSFLIGLLIALISIVIFIIILWNNYPNNNLETNSSSEKFNYNLNQSDINNFTTNKFLYPTGPISNQDCQKRCKDRFEKCNSYTPIGTNKWCEYDYDECQRSCQWNSIFASN
jgi:hypothetical protein